ECHAPLRANRPKHSTSPTTPIARTMPPTMRPAGTPSSGGWMRHLDSRYGTNPAIVPGATQKNTNDPSTAPTVLVTPLLRHHAFVRRTMALLGFTNGFFHERCRGNLSCETTPSIE